MVTGTKKNSKTAAQRPTSSRTKKRVQSKNQELEAEFIQGEVVLIASFAVAVLLFLSNFHLCGVAGDYLRKVQLGIFGMIGFVAPVLLFVGVCFGISNQRNPIASLKIVAGVLGIFTLCGLTEMVFGGGYQDGQKIMDAFIRSSESGWGGGLIGGVFAQGLGSIVGVVGTYLILLVVLAICCVCVTEKSLVEAVKRSGGKAYQYAKEDVDRRREIYEERKEEKKRQKEQQRVRGVNLSSTKINHEEGLEGDSLDSEYGYGEENDTNEQEPYKTVSKAASKVIPEEPKKEDIFIGKISLPPNYIEEEPDMSFDEEDVRIVEEVLRNALQDIDDKDAEVSDKNHIENKNEAEDKIEEEWYQPSYSADEIETGLSHSQISQEQLYTFKNRNSYVAETKKQQIPKQPYLQEDKTQTKPVYQTEDNIEHSTEIDQMYLPEEKMEHHSGTENRDSIEDKEVENSRTDQSDIQDADEGYISPYKDEPMPETITHWVPELHPEPESHRKLKPRAAEEFQISQENKRVVTNTGKVIENDTDALKKKLESKRKEVQEKSQPKEVVKKEYKFPPMSLLKRGSRPSGSYSEQQYKDTAIKLQQTLKNFGVGVTVTNISCGPSVTRYELRPEQGVKVSKIVGLSDDIKLSLAAADIRIEAPIPGRSAVGIEVPNKENTTVYLREIFESEDFKNASSSLSFAVGKDIGGQVVVTDIAKMPHLLIAGATGSGKSVCINTLIMSILFKSSPDDVKMIMIDPKVVELSAYNGIPHLLIPVVTDPKKASGALNWAVGEMMSRYDKFAQYNVRNLKGYNVKVESIKQTDSENKPQKMPQIVIIIDELADLMMVSPGEVEEAICRLAQLARAAGIHLVIATQRPSVNVITGLIKANVPSRIAFSVSSGVDSRTIIDMYGAEKLLGKGDMLFYPSGIPKPQRVQGAFVSDQEVGAVVEFLAGQGIGVPYQPDIESRISTSAASSTPEQKNHGRDEYFEQAGKFIIEKEKASTSMLQRMYKIGFNRASRIMDQLAKFGVVGEEEGTKPRKVLMTMEEFEDLLAQK